MWNDLSVLRRTPPKIHQKYRYRSVSALFFPILDKKCWKYCSARLFSCKKLKNEHFLRITTDCSWFFWTYLINRVIYLAVFYCGPGKVEKLQLFSVALEMVQYRNTLRAVLSRFRDEHISVYVFRGNLRIHPRFLRFLSAFRCISRNTIFSLSNPIKKNSSRPNSDQRSKIEDQHARACCLLFLYILPVFGHSNILI